MILIEHHVMVKVNNTSRFFRDKIEIFSNLVVRDEIKICFFYISCFETRSRICFTTSRISRRGRETKQLILEVEREFSMLILARHFEIENSRQCLFDCEEGASCQNKLSNLVGGSVCIIGFYYPGEILWPLSLALRVGANRVRSEDGARQVL